MGKKGVTEKLLIKKGEKIVFVNQPDYFYDELNSIEDIIIEDEVSPEMDLIILFVNNKGELEEYAPIVMKNIKYDGVLWICYPKKSSGIETDISKYKGWDILYKNGYKAVSQISIDEIWSAIRFRKVELIKKKREK